MNQTQNTEHENQKKLSETQTVILTLQTREDVQAFMCGDIDVEKHNICFANDDMSRGPKVLFNEFIENKDWYSALTGWTGEIGAGELNAARIQDGGTLVLISD